MTFVDSNCPLAMPPTLQPSVWSVRRRDRGFTLLELVVALAVFAVVSAAAYGGLRIILDARDATTHHQERLARLQTTMALFAREVEQVVPREVRDGFGDGKLALVAENSAVEFTHAGWRNPAGLTQSNLQRVAYRLVEGDFVRFHWKVLDLGHDSEPTQRVLLDKLSELEFKFLDHQRSWHSQWPPPETEATTELPIALEVVLDLGDWGVVRRLIRLSGD